MYLWVFCKVKKNFRGKKVETLIQEAERQINKVLQKIVLHVSAEQDSCCEWLSLECFRSAVYVCVKWEGQGGEMLQEDPWCAFFSFHLTGHLHTHYTNNLAVITVIIFYTLFFMWWRASVGGLIIMRHLHIFNIFKYFSTVKYTQCTN